MGYSQLIKAKAEKKYPEDFFSRELPLQSIRRQAYIDCLTDVKGLYDAAKDLMRMKVTDFLSKNKAGWEAMREAIEQFEKI